jgi:putative transposase
MAHTHSNILVHAIFSTKERRPLLNKGLKPRMHAYLGGVVREIGGVAIRINGTNDHVHMLMRVPPVIAIADLIRDVKASSSKWAGKFAWQTGYGAFSVGESAAQRVMRYIEEQEHHHRKMTFQEEYLSFLKRHKIDYDPRFIWD